MCLWPVRWWDELTNVGPQRVFLKKKLEISQIFLGMVFLINKIWESILIHFVQFVCTISWRNLTVTCKELGNKNDKTWHFHDHLLAWTCNYIIMALFSQTSAAISKDGLPVFRLKGYDGDTYNKDAVASNKKHQQKPGWSKTGGTFPSLCTSDQRKMPEPGGLSNRRPKSSSNLIPGGWRVAPSPTPMLLWVWVALYLRFFSVDFLSVEDWEV